MNEPLNKELYEKVKRMADAIYSVPSAFKSSYIVRAYSDLGGKYSGKKTTEGLTRWHKEKWADVGNKQYPVYRPTKRVNKKTPLTVQEIDPKNLKEQIKLKQKIKSKKNLPPFKPK
jgi:hypothetical protein